MQRDFVIKKVRPSAWVYAEDGNDLPVQFQLANNGWRFIPDDYAVVQLVTVIRIRRVEYMVTVYADQSMTIYMLDKDEKTHSIDSLNIPPGHPAIKFFRKTNTFNGVKSTIPLDISFNKQKYGTGEDNV